MSMRNDTIVIAGNIGNDPTKNETRNGKAVINFRVGTSHNYVDQRTGEWVEGPTSWYNVSAFGNIAEHAKASLHRGDPVIVVGRLRIRDWEAGDGKKGREAEITADAIGHDLNWGTSAFVRRQRATTEPARVPQPSDADAPSDDAPSADEGDAWRTAGLEVLVEDEASKEPAFT
ncbi:MAG: hypothetical protein BGN97_00610 [Microbacterium sp. 69-10]|uniref:single-stranded DNA-binding protein n=1 Tax=Microbacterium sp. 69-10 TaxID=1895783 RepID=UPI000959B690|nr:single-stranded DNA-binding protein [Microbacterium sp. 69-10]OJU39749.1 MAG: hypothetical protein BGN97_00610 [Microbacterium sp. 69-10]